MPESIIYLDLLLSAYWVSWAYHSSLAIHDFVFGITEIQVFVREPRHNSMEDMANSNHVGLQKMSEWIFVLWMCYYLHLVLLCSMNQKQFFLRTAFSQAPKSLGVVVGGNYPQWADSYIFSVLIFLYSFLETQGMVFSPKA